jgi:hypothetical protein
MSAPEPIPGRSPTTAHGSTMAAQPAPTARRSSPRSTAAAETPSHPDGIDVTVTQTPQPRPKNPSKTLSVAEVFGGASGTGYVVGPDLILTASHAVAHDHEVSVRVLGSADWIDADVIWHGSESVDAVLLTSPTPTRAIQLTAQLPNVIA